MKFRKKPIVIEAVQVKATDYNGHRGCDHANGPCWDIKTLEGVVTAGPGDWIIRGIKGELYPCKDDIFKMTYEPEEAKKAPTIEELEAILNSKDDVKVTINPNGSVSYNDPKSWHC